MKIKLFALLGLPWLIITGMIVGAYLPIYLGDKYLLPVKPRDPRDFFRGNYVDLQYDFSLLAAKDIEVKLAAGKGFQFGDRLYLEFENRNGSLRAIALTDTVSATKNIRLKVQPRWSITANATHFDLVSGLESFFAPKEAAEDWENALREGKVFAEVAIDRSGNARLVKLIKKPAAAPAKPPADDTEE